MNERILFVRKTLKLTQDDFAEKLNLSKNFVWMIEKGNRVPSDRTICDICEKFNVNEDWLRTGNGEMFVEQTRDEQISEFVGRIQHLEDDSFKKRMISMLSKLNESDWEVLERMALEMSKEK